MYDIDAEPKVERTHEPTGLKFSLKPITPRKNQELLKQCRGKDGVIDHVMFNGLIVEAAVVAWEGVGSYGVLIDPTDTPLNDKGQPYKDDKGQPVLGTKRRFGERLPDVANWIYAQATDSKIYCDEVEEAKND